MVEREEHMDPPRVSAVGWKKCISSGLKMYSCQSCHAARMPSPIPGTCSIVHGVHLKNDRRYSCASHVSHLPMHMYHICPISCSMTPSPPPCVYLTRCVPRGGGCHHLISCEEDSLSPTKQNVAMPWMTPCLHC